MEDIKIDVDLATFRAGLTDVEKRQFPFAAALALNDVAQDTVEGFREEMSEEFDRPTRWTLSAFFVRRATKAKLSALVERKTPQRGRHYLAIQSSGGQRQKTGLEKLLVSRLPYAGNLEAVVPAKGAKLNSSGNWSPGQRNQVLSILKSQRDSTANTTDRSAKRAKGRASYFVPKPGGPLTPGVYQRTGAKRRGVVKVLHFLSAVPNYRQGVHFKEAAEHEVRSKFLGHFRKRFAAAMASAK